MRESRAALTPTRLAGPRRAIVPSILALGLLASQLHAQSPAVTALRFGALVDASGQSLRDAVVVVRGDTIVSMGSGSSAVPAGAWVMDLRPLTAIPGLIDMHTHMTYVRDKVTSPQGPSPSSTDSIIFMAAWNAMRTLETGVTTVRDLNAGAGRNIAMRDAINSGAMVGPRMFVSGQGLSKRANDTVPIDIRAAVRARVDAGADWTKMFGSTGSGQNVTSNQMWTDEEMRITTASTATTPRCSGTREAVSRLDSFVVLNLETTRRAHAAGVKIAMGSDALYWMFGENTCELGWFVKAGMTPAEALATATTNAAALLGMGNKLGRIAAGYLADIVAVEGDPLSNINVVLDGVRWVMKDGKVVVDKRRRTRADRGRYPGPRPGAPPRCTSSCSIDPSVPARSASRSGRASADRSPLSHERRRRRQASRVYSARDGSRSDA